MSPALFQIVSETGSKIQRSYCHNLTVVLVSLKPKCGAASRVPGDVPADRERSRSVSRVVAEPETLRRIEDWPLEFQCSGFKVS